jgi:predicted RNA-binding protein with PUA-like domain
MPNKTDHWDGVRNYQARNFMMKDMKKGDLAFFYHSNCKEPGIVGVATIVREAYPDFTAQDAKSPYYDPKSRITTRKAQKKTHACLWLMLNTYAN